MQPAIRMGAPMDKNASSTLTDFSAWLAQVDPAEGPGDGQADGNGRMYGGLTVLERRAVRRQRLLDAGLELFSRGYALATIEGICAGAGVTARHFYEEFGSREELLKAVFDRSIDTTILEIIEKVDGSTVAPDDLDGLVRQGTGAFVHAFLDDPRRARSFFESLVQDNVGIGRPEQVAMVFQAQLRTRGPRRTPGPFRTRVFSPGTEVKIDFSFKHSRVKQYLILCSQRKKCSRHEDGYFVDMSLTHRPRGPNAWFRPRPGAVREPVPADRGAVDFPAGDG